MNLKFTRSQKRINFFVEQAVKNHLYLESGLFQFVYKRPEHVKIAVAAMEGDQWVGIAMKFEPTSFEDFAHYHRYVLRTEPGQLSANFRDADDIFHRPLDCGFYVRPDFRRTGIGRKLFNKLSSLSAEKLNYYRGYSVEHFFKKVA